MGTLETEGSIGRGGGGGGVRGVGGGRGGLIGEGFGPRRISEFCATLRVWWKVINALYHYREVKGNESVPMQPPSTT
jgi:hypothetical protein